MKKFLVIGAFGQVGTVLVPTLQKEYGDNNVVAIGHQKITNNFQAIVEKGNILDPKKIAEIIKKYQITDIVNLASYLSVKSEIDPQGAWQVNLLGLKNVLDIANEFDLQVFWPSSIAVFGPTTPKINTPQDTVIEPTTMYGLTKRAGELLCQYYFLKYNLDVRSVRFPGLLDYKTPPSQGTTEYAKWMFYHALEKGEYTCPLKPNTTLPMMYMEDAIEATIKLIKAPKNLITIRTSYNLSAFSFSPQELFEAIKKYLPNFKINYAIDETKQRIADSWPQTIDDHHARKDWGHQPKFDFDKTVQVLMENIKNIIKKNE